MSEIVKLENLQETFPQLQKNILSVALRIIPNFSANLCTDAPDLVYSQSDKEMLRKARKSAPEQFVERAFIATEIGASFAKKEISFIPYEIFKKETVNGVETKKKTRNLDGRYCHC